MRSATIQVQPRGNVVLPAKLRAKYGLDAGGNLTVIDLDGSILLSPQATVVPSSPRRSSDYVSLPASILRICCPPAG